VLAAAPLMDEPKEPEGPMEMPDDIPGDEGGRDPW
jgi:hypothetical protein